MGSWGFVLIIRGPAATTGLKFDLISPYHVTFFELKTCSISEKCAFLCLWSFDLGKSGNTNLASLNLFSL